MIVGKQERERKRGKEKGGKEFVRDRVRGSKILSKKERESERAR